MVELLAVEKARLLAERGEVTSQDFREAWAECWWVMILERAYPHATRHRRAWRAVLQSTKPEMRAAFLDDPTAFAFAAGRLTEGAGGMCLRLSPAQVPAALLAAIAYVQTLEDREAMTDELVAA